MAARVPAKSILKQVSHQPKKASSLTDEQKAEASKNQRNLKIALHHANLIQQQKDITYNILESIVKLVDFPTSNPFSARDAHALTTILEPFQPSDFNNLIEERRIDGKCGYALCSQAPRLQTLGQGAVWKLKAGAADFCSNVCARKAVYLKAQLSEVPAWERSRGQRVGILLHEDDRPSEDVDAGVRRARRTERVETWRQTVAGEEELARERGERVGGFRPKEVMTDMVIEKTPGDFRAPVAPDADEGDLALFGAIEGYEPKPILPFRPAKNDKREDQSDED